MKRLSGLTLLEEREGEERSAQKGDRIVCTGRLYLNKGDEVPLNAKQKRHTRPRSPQRGVDSGAVGTKDHRLSNPGLRSMV